MSLFVHQRAVCSHSEDFEALEQGERGGAAFALGPGGLHRHQLGGGRGGHLLKAGRGHLRRGGEAKEVAVLADEERANRK